MAHSNQRHFITNLTDHEAQRLQAAFLAAGFLVKVTTAADCTADYELDGSIGEGVFGAGHKVIRWRAQLCPDNDREYLHEIAIQGEGRFYVRCERYNITAARNRA